MKRQIKIDEKTCLRVHVSEKDVHFAGGLVNGAWVLGLFGDVATEITIRYDGDEGLLARYTNVELKAPIRAGDFIEVKGWVSKVGNTSRTLEFEAYRYIKSVGTPFPSSADYLPEPELVAKATMINVVPKKCQRLSD